MRRAWATCPIDTSTGPILVFLFMPWNRCLFVLLLALALLGLAGCASPARPALVTAAPTAGTGPGDAAVNELLLSALAFIDAPYRRGGQGPQTGFDCSGFTRHLYGSVLGLELARRAEQQAADRRLSEVGDGPLAAGDLVFFNTLQRRFSHVGIYLGDGRFIHAPREGSQVRIEDMRLDYWASRFDGARRADAVGIGPVNPTR